ncbi:YARHG domain-containing protein [Myroides marinus]|uniref:YARHG domain-containing protein n=1 Tax=Myroides marinus TaxID=703342 RepID=A0A1H6VAG0_9FLAO|nr:YARHG domain-containing protein [Myroides marinus]SEJ01551.1 YARHG domain-containing protein [Myroides marinus]
MKKLGLVMLSLILLTSCKKDKVNQLETNDQEEVYAKESDLGIISDFDKKYGLWSGDFEADVVNHENSGVYSSLNIFTIVVQSIKGKKVEGYSVSAGNVRPFIGEVVETTAAGQYIVVKEPGDHKYDGVFKFTISPDKSSIKGNWYSNRKDLPVISRKFDIKKKDFNYDPTVMLKPYIEEVDGYEEESTMVDWINDREKIIKYDGGEYVTSVNRAASEEIYRINASTKKLSEKELKNLHKLDLEIIRNTIYARHGYTFANRGARQFFNYVDWYIPLYNNVENELTDVEKSNIKLIKRLEKYAEDYYQQYGR